MNSMVRLQKALALTISQTEARGLKTWHKAVASIPLNQMLPKGFGSRNDFAKNAAFLGDKIIGLAVARCIYDQGSEEYQSGHTALLSHVISNTNFAYNLKSILPEHVDERILSLASIQIHDAGTMVEAAVTAVEKTNSQEEARAAIENLARWLISNGLKNLKKESSNPKGYLLELGGTVNGRKLPGFPQHDPRFEATAKLGLDEASAVDSNKKKSEQEAARRLLLLRLSDC